MNLSFRITTGRSLRRAIVAMMVSAAALPAVAMRIVITNDEGFESRNIQALFFALRAAGHDVILSAPYRNQSGASAQLGSLSDIPRTNAPSPGGTIASGAPGVGPTTIAADQYYVDSSPIGALFGASDALVDPMVELFDRESRLVGTNDNWSDDAAKVSAIADAAARVGAYAWS